MNYDFVESFAQMVREKGIDRDVLGGILEEIFGLLVKKKYGEEAKFDVVVNMDRGDIEIFLEREIVDVVEDPNKQISIDEVNKIMTNGLNAGGIEPNEMRDYGFMQQRTIEDFDGHTWEVFYMDMTNFPTDQPNA